jgi:ABC-type protease/lipase transport system fused ATPase/permease subunit
MGIGSGIALFVIGAILYFAVHVQVAFVDLSIVGLILMVAGIVLFLVALLLTLRGRRTVVSRSDQGGRTVRETTDRDPYL